MFVILNLGRAIRRELGKGLLFCRYESHGVISMHHALELGHKLLRI